ncbi:hypothetical protein [Sphingomicrobium astaxanthinifaciens]|uniref:hypothetical protein n=1 Tax=Sphingomicrobium astaxanthinifaciens TaxID=1227949 RepID=UPI001FCBA8FF|nr:hypothetical protein [Sphingomicrobium astaxanthinifaciens]MCJ7421371.1 hypothetical protein [Sphingomicrobium astaxanthinifaciens]
MRKTVLLLSAASLALTSGCATSLHTERDYRFTDEAAVLGVPYHLPMLQYEVTLTTTLASCEGLTKDGKPDGNPNVRLLSKVEATPHHVPGETYLLDYRQLSNWAKTSSFELTDHEKTGTLATLNASAEDRSAQIFGSVVETVIGMAALGAGIPKVETTAANGEKEVKNVPVLECSEYAKKALAALREQTETVETLGGKLKVVTAQIEKLNNHSGALAETEKTNLLKAGGLLDQQKHLTTALKAARATLLQQQRDLGIVRTIRWPSKFSRENKESFSMDEQSRARLAKLVAIKEIPETTRTTQVECKAEETGVECLTRGTGITLSIDPLTTQAVRSVASRRRDQQDQEASNRWAYDPARAQAGLFVRPPGRGQLVARRTGDGTELLRGKVQAVPQLGQLRLLPFSNGRLENNALTLELRTDGAIKSIKYEDKAAAGEVAAKAAADAVGQFGALAQALRDDREADAAAALAQIEADRDAELAALQFEIDRETKEQALLQLKAGPEVSPTAAYEAQTAAAEARTVLLNALVAELVAQRKFEAEQGS